MSPRLRTVIVTNIPAPYRLPVWRALAREPDIDLHVVFCSGREPDRDWDLADLDFPHSFLPERFCRLGGRFVHHNPGVWALLSRLAPQAVVTTGFNPTHLVAFAWARRHGALHVSMTDGTALSERRLTAVHRMLRRHVYARSEAFIGASEGSFELYRAYGVRASAMFKSHLCADNEAFGAEPPVTRDVDLLFCGRFVDGKRPLFTLEVAAATARRLGRRLRLRFVGSGPLEAALREAAQTHEGLLDVEFTGFARQRDLPAHYARSKLLLFPTAGDTWGVVANEACAAGTPVITTPDAGVAGELVVDRRTGRVEPADLHRWVDAVAALLADDALRSALGGQARMQVAEYHHGNAASGLAAALRHAWRTRRDDWQNNELPAALLPRRQRPRIAVLGRLGATRAALLPAATRRLAEQGIDLRHDLHPRSATWRGLDLAVLPASGDWSSAMLRLRLARHRLPYVIWCARDEVGGVGGRADACAWIADDASVARWLARAGVPQHRIARMPAGLPRPDDAAATLVDGLLMAMRGLPLPRRVPAVATVVAT